MNKKLTNKKKLRKMQYRNMMAGALVMLAITTVATKSNQPMNTADAYMEQQILTREDVIQREIMNYREEDELLKVAYMSIDKMDELGIKEGDIYSISGDAYIVELMEKMEDHVIILPHEDDTEGIIYKYID